MEKDKFIIDTTVKIAANMVSPSSTFFMPSQYILYAEQLWEELVKAGYIPDQLKKQSPFKNSDLS